MLSDIAALAVPLLIVGGAVYVDLRTRRGYGLALLSLGLLGLALLTLHDILVVRRIPDSEALGYNFGIGVFFMAGGYFVLLLWLGALIEAGRSRQKRWLTALLVTAPLSGLAFLVAGWVLARMDLDATLAADLLLIGLPALVVLAYGVFRCVRPIQPATLRRLAVPAR